MPRQPRIRGKAQPVTGRGAAARALPQLGLSRPASRYGRWRAATLALVYVLMGIHVAHWRISGKTLAPLELNEVMYTLELGIVTAGFLFMATVCLATLLFGRFFCGWGCHILALEDLCAWLLKKIRVRPKPVRSRLLLLVPPLAMFYMFLWPQVLRVMEGRPLPTLHLRTDGQGWASFQTTDFWRNLPGPGIALLTFAICGFAIVYVLGSRSFCTYVCPYGSVFRGMDRLSPGRIIATGDCSECGACTAVCPSHVVVHEELKKYGTVVNPACLKDLECVAACPKGLVRYGLARPPLLRGWSAWKPIRRVFDFTWAEEAWLVSITLGVLLAFRGLYDAAPFLMTLGLGVIVAYLGLCVVRTAYQRDVRFGPGWLRRAGRITRFGTIAYACSAAFVAFWAHCAFIRFHEYTGHRAAAAAIALAEQAQHPGHAGADADSLQPDSTAAAPMPVASIALAEEEPGGPNAIQESTSRAIVLLERCARWGLLQPPRLLATLTRLYTLRAEARVAAADVNGAIDDLKRVVRLDPGAAGIHYNLGVLCASNGRDVDAITHYSWAAAINPTDPDVFNNLGFVQTRRRAWPDAERSLRRALELQQGHALAHFNLARVLDATGRQREAEQHLATAFRLDSQLAQAAGSQP
ncbi:MAG: 4Fe-4S binding protein [Phycisphaerales bacterium]|nr:4Fe-4S binding protein [Phycisphaerales bacterium]